MDFAANAVVDVIAPPPRAGGAKTAPAPSNEPTFDDHLEAAAPEEGREDTAAPTEEPQRAGETEPAENTEGVAPAPAPQPEPTAAPVLVQLIAAVEPQAPAPVFAPAPDAVAPAPVEPASAPVNDAPEAALTASANAETMAAPQTSAKSEAGQEKSAQTAPAKVAPVTALVADDVVKVAPTVAPHTQATQSTPPSTEQTTEAETATWLLANAPREASHRPKGEPRGEFKVESSTQEGNAPAPRPTGSKTNSAKAAPVVANAKDNGPVAPLPQTSGEGSAPSSLAPAPTAAQAMTHTQHASLDQSGARAAPAAAQVAREIVRRFDGENTRFELRLDPPELGRVEVRLEVSRDHRVTAVVAADSPQALTELARHARELEQTLQSAGLELADNGLSFDLRQGREGAGDAGDAGSTSGAGEGSEDAPQEPAVAARPIGLERWRGVRVDVTV